MHRYLTTYSILPVCIVLLTLVLLAEERAKPPAEGELDAQKGQLARLQGLVGSWKGVASPIRGSDKGAWIERADWAWKFADKSASLVVKIDDGKYFSSAELRPGAKAGEYFLVAKTSDGKGTIHYAGQLDKEEKLTLVAKIGRAHV